MGSIVIHQLANKYARLLGEHSYIEREAEDAEGAEAIDEAAMRIAIRQRYLRKRMADIEGTIALYDPCYRVEYIRPIRPQRQGARTGWSRHIYAVLREAQVPMTTRDIAKKVVASLGIPVTEDQLIRASSAVYGTLKPQIGKMVRVVEGVPMRWMRIRPEGRIGQR